MKKKIEKVYYKIVGKITDETGIAMILTATWDGKYPVEVYFPRNMTVKIKEQVIDFILGELDDHDAYDEFRERLKKRNIRVVK